VKDGTACVLKWKRAHLHIRLAIHNDAHVRSLESEHNDRLCTDDDNAFLYQRYGLNPGQFLWIYSPSLITTNGRHDNIENALILFFRESQFLKIECLIHSFIHSFIHLFIHSFRLFL